MRSGRYAVVDGVEYPVEIWKGQVSLFIPRVGEKSEGWANGGFNTWCRVVDASEVSSAFEVLTSAMLDDVKVRVERVDPAAREAVVSAKKGASINDQYKTPPHPLLEAVPESSYSLIWMGTVPWDRLTDVYDACGPIDPNTGRYLPG